jgi:hypothetical protein
MKMKGFSVDPYRRDLRRVEVENDLQTGQHLAPVQVL